MNYGLTRTSMALDHGTVVALKYLAEKWEVSKAEVLRRAVKRLRDDAEKEEKAPKPLQALDWLQSGGGLSVQEAETFREELLAERQAKRYWWES